MKKSDRLNSNKKRHYDLIRGYFRNSAVKKKRYYSTKDINKLFQKIRRREMWETYLSSLDVILNKNQEIRNVIDVGCGMGNFILELVNRKQFNRIIGIDFLRDTFNIARQNQELFSKVAFIEGDLLNIPFKDRTFDLTICLNVLHHIHYNDVEKVIQELTRLTDGFIILEIRNKKFILNFFYKYLIKSNQYKKLPIFTNLIKDINDIFKKYSFQNVKIMGKRKVLWANRRVILIYKKNQ